MEEFGFNVTLRRLYERTPKGQHAVTHSNGVRGLNHFASMSCTGPICFKTKRELKIQILL